MSKAIANLILSAALIAQVTDNPHIEKVWFSKDGGEYTLQIDKNHPIELTRDEILDSEASDDAAKDGSVDKPKGANELIAEIMIADSAEDIDDLVGSDTRKTVLAAAEKAKAALAGKE